MTQFRSYYLDRGVYMKPEKISHINDKSILHNDRKKRSVLELNGNNGRIVAYHPFKSMQIIFYDIHSN